MASETEPSHKNKCIFSQGIAALRLHQSKEIVSFFRIAVTMA